MQAYSVFLKQIISTVFFIALYFFLPAQTPNAVELFDKMQKAYSEKEILAYNVTDTGDFSPGNYLVIFEKDSTKNLIGGNFLIRRSDGFYKICYKDSSFWVHPKYKEDVTFQESSILFHQTHYSFLHFFGYARNTGEDKYLQIEETDSSYIRRYIVPNEYVSLLDIDKSSCLITNEFYQNAVSEDDPVLWASKIKYLDTEAGNYSDTIRLWYQKSLKVPLKKAEKRSEPPKELETLTANKRIPDFEGMLWKDSTKFTLKKMQNDKKKIFIFWSFGCAYSSLMLEQASKIKDKFPDVDFFTVLNPDEYNDSKETINKTIKSSNSDIPIILVSKDVFKTYKVVAFPTSFVTDKNYKLIGQWTGVNKRISLKERLSNLLYQ
jgi:thiol-disulfide isomerase/thioredoxin